jgi:hypothetical protein
MVNLSSVHVDFRFKWFNGVRFRSLRKKARLRVGGSAQAGNKMTGGCTLNWSAFGLLNHGRVSVKRRISQLAHAHSSATSA